MLGPRTETGDEAQPLSRTRDQIGIYAIGHSRHQHVAILHRARQLLAGERRIALVQHHIEQLAHTRLDARHQVAGDDYARRAGKRARGALSHGAGANASKAVRSRQDQARAA